MAAQPFLRDLGTVSPCRGGGRAEGENVAVVSRLRHEESVRLAQERLAELYVQLGESGAQDVICRAMQELALRLGSLEEAYARGDHAALAKGARGLVGIADQVGMASLARVAEHVQECTNRQDPVALPAVLARLLRIGDSSLTAVWDLQDLSG